MIALVDCNNFFVSCERVFRPDLEKKPVLVLSNNDGCVVSRSNEVKAMGIPMGVPFFKVKNIVDQYDVTVFSSNFSLYADMSHRVQEVLGTCVPDIEVYSVDEAFLNFDCIAEKDFDKYARQIRDKVMQWTGIPVSIGIAKTKTLAKVANELAKKNPTYNGVLDFSKHPSLDSFLEQTPVDDIWGVGRKYAVLLKSYDIFTALDFTHQSDAWIRKHMTVMGLKTLWELKGVSCIDLKLQEEARKTITSSRSFGRPVETYQELSEAVATYISRGCEKLREQGSVASYLSVYIMTNRFKEDRYIASLGVELPFASNYTPDFIKAAENALKQIYRPGLQYKKAGIWIANISNESVYQENLFITQGREEKKKEAMLAMDSINHKMGRDTVQIATAGVKKDWKMKSEHLSQKMTLNWRELPKARTI